MGLYRILSFCAFAMIAWVSLIAHPALAHDHSETDRPIAPRCHASSGLDTSISEMASGAKSGARWTCSDTNWIAHEPVAWLLFDAQEWADTAPPQFFFSRIARHKSVTFTAVDADGSTRTLEWQEADGKPLARGPVFRLRLPVITSQTQALIARIEKPHSVPLLTEARLAQHTDNVGWAAREVIIVAFVLGMLVLPLFFDFSFFLVLRDRLMVLHAAMVLAMMGYVLSASGLIAAFPFLSVRSIAVAGPLMWSVGIGLSALFLAEFLEEGAQSPRMRRITLGAALWCFLVPSFFALQLHATQPIDDPGYFIAFVPVIAVVTVAVTQAAIKRNRGGIFLAVAWTPIWFTSGERLLRGMGFYTGPSTLDLGIYLAAGFEVIVISLSIGVRFLEIRRERDEALIEARMQEQLSTRDALTGLLNRRGLKVGFDELIERGFDTFALIDLDHFKNVNDRHGHQIGDAALIACGKALRANGNADVVTARLGGEEFVLLLRGPNALGRVETLRQSIPLRIAADVEGLEAPVTASSGVIEVPRASNTMMDFETLYARADALMYEAKASGRNRMLYERVTVFESAPPARPGHERRAQGVNAQGRRAGDAPPSPANAA